MSNDDSTGPFENMEGTVWRVLQHDEAMCAAIADADILSIRKFVSLGWWDWPGGKTEVEKWANELKSGHNIDFDSEGWPGMLVTFPDVFGGPTEGEIYSMASLRKFFLRATSRERELGEERRTREESTRAHLDDFDDLLSAYLPFPSVMERPPADDADNQEVPPMECANQ